MKRTCQIVFLLFVFCQSAMAASVNSTLDCGGQTVTNGLCCIDGSLGGIGGSSSNVSSGGILNSGYIGQLTEVTNLAVTGSGSIPELGVNQLGAVARLDDATLIVLAGADVEWRAPASPIDTISAAGLATALSVCTDTCAAVTGSYLGVSGSGVFMVLDSDSDNYGLYAGDQIPDWWQVRYFGVNNAQGVASATNFGRSNLYAYMADLNPTNPASFFKIMAITNQSPNRVVYFSPASTGRVYALQYETDLTLGAWTFVTAVTNKGNGGVFSLSDTNTATVRFYKVYVQMP